MLLYSWLIVGRWNKEVWHLEIEMLSQKRHLSASTYNWWASRLWRLARNGDGTFSHANWRLPCASSPFRLALRLLWRCPQLPMRMQRCRCRRRRRCCCRCRRQQWQMLRRSLPPLTPVAVHVVWPCCRPLSRPSCLVDPDSGSDGCEDWYWSCYRDSERCRSTAADRYSCWSFEAMNWKWKTKEYKIYVWTNHVNFFLPLIINQQ